MQSDQSPCDKDYSEDQTKAKPVLNLKEQFDKAHDIEWAAVLHENPKMEQSPTLRALFARAYHTGGMKMAELLDQAEKGKRIT